MVCAAVFCVAAQIVAACCGANFGRHTWRTAGFTRLLLLCGYLAAAAFATYSADQGWMAATSGPHVAAMAARTNERGRIEAEIAEREAYVRSAEDQRARVIAPGPTLTAQRQAPFTETIARNEARLRELRADLEALAPLPPERARTIMDWAAFLAFGFWQILEPWLYHAVEAGRRASYQSRRNETDETAETRKSHAVSWPFKTAGLAVALAASASQASAYVPENTGVLNLTDSDSVVRLPDTSPKAKAFALRGRIKPAKVAIEVGVSRATIYRWYRARDKALQAARAA